jgi:hypothetical protein
MSEINPNVGANSPLTQYSNSAADLGGTQSVGNQSNLSLMDQSSLLHGDGSAWSVENPQRNLSQINIEGPAKPSGTVTTGTPNANGQFPGTITNGPVTATTTRGIGQDPKQPTVTGVNAKIPLAPGVTGNVGVTSANGGTLTGGVSATGNLSNNVTGTIGVSGTQPINGNPGTTTVSGSLQSGGTTVRGSTTNGPTGTTNQIGVTQQLGNSGQVGASASFAPAGTTVTVNGSYQVSPDLNITGSYSNGPTGQVGQVGVGFNF